MGRLQTPLARRDRPGTCAGVKIEVAVRMLKITGYADRIYCRPGDTIKFMVNCELPAYRADLVRIICGDNNPKGPGVKEQIIDSSFTLEHPGRRQEIRSGSCLVVPDCDALRGLRDFTIQAYIWPTTPMKGLQ